MTYSRHYTTQNDAIRYDPHNLLASARDLRHRLRRASGGGQEIEGCGSGGCFGWETRTLVVRKIGRWWPVTQVGWSSQRIRDGSQEFAEIVDGRWRAVAPQPAHNTPGAPPQGVRQHHIAVTSTLRCPIFAKHAAADGLGSDISSPGYTTRRYAATRRGAAEKRG